MSEKTERRLSARKEVLETFQVFLVIPQKGLRKIYLKDVSEGGMGFISEPMDHFKSGDIIDCYFYINPSLRLPLSFKVAHVSASEEAPRVGCQFNDKSTKAYKTFVSFMRLLDELSAFLDA